MRKFFRSLALALALHLAGRFAVAYLWRTSLKTARVRAHRLAGLAWLLWGRKNRSQVIANIAKALPAREQETGQETEQGGEQKTEPRRGQATEVKATEVKATEVKATEVKATEVKATEAKAIARQSFALLLRNFADLGQTPRYSNRSLPLDERLLDPAIESLFATPTVWVTGHFAAWEAACGALAPPRFCAVQLHRSRLFRFVADPSSRRTAGNRGATRRWHSDSFVCPWRARGFCQSFARGFGRDRVSGVFLRSATSRSHAGQAFEPRSLARRYSRALGSALGSGFGLFSRPRWHRGKGGKKARYGQAHRQKWHSKPRQGDGSGIWANSFAATEKPAISKARRSRSPSPMSKTRRLV